MKETSMSRNVPFQRGNSKDFTLSCNETLWRMKYKSICCIQIYFQRLRNICRKKRSSVILLTIQCPSWKRMLHHRGKWQNYKMQDLFHFSYPPISLYQQVCYWRNKSMRLKDFGIKEKLDISRGISSRSSVYPGLPQYWDQCTIG